ncbi:MAG TPA: hypothetical protein PLU27_11340 [Ginsengibacter sp.]|nr:hypothetical protein [Ginsengibacter sp.]
MKKMENHNPEFRPLQTVRGVTGGSGLVYHEKKLYILSDDSDFLFGYNLHGNQLEKVSLKDSGTPGQVMKKHLKPDFEAIAATPDRYFIFGSGSAENRFDMVELDADLKFISRSSLSALYRNIMHQTGINEQNFNIEGVIVKGPDAYFFNRGNGPQKQNGIIIVKNWRGTSYQIEKFIPIDLPTRDGFAFTFSDAILLEDSIYFLATAEKTTSVYDDGEILGSALGVLALRSLEMTDFHFLTKDYKLEGITFQYKQAGRLHFLISEDADNSEGGTTLFQLSLEAR